MGWVGLRRASVRLRVGLVLRGVCVAVGAAGIAACSSDTGRFDANPFASRHAATNEATGSVAPARSAKIETKPSYSSQPLPPPAAQAGGHQPLTQSADVTGSISSPRNWQWDGGTPVVVAQGETIETMALRYNVPGGAIMQANNLNDRSVLRAGQQIVIPKMKYASARNAPAMAAPHSRAPKLASTQAATHVVAPGETLMGISRRYHTPVRDIVAANRLTYDARLKIGDKLVIPGVAAAAAPPAPIANTKIAAKVTPPPVAAKTSPVLQKVASAEPTSTARMTSPSAAAGETSAASGNGANPQFRWPVRGRVISGFGPIANGQQNDGINLAVPEGTVVRAAEDGTVAYAGSELKGYGNLVLVRHNDGYVTAYAHASELMVKRGDTVRRGQVIAKSGQTGTVTAPQLHFEIRKGSAPVDPMKFLPGA